MTLLREVGAEIVEKQRIAGSTLMLSHNRRHLVLPGDERPADYEATVPLCVGVLPHQVVALLVRMRAYEGEDEASTLEVQPALHHTCFRRCAYRWSAG